MYYKLLDYCKKLNIIVGVGSAKPFNITYESIKDTPFVSFDYKKRIDPRETMADANSLIAIGIPYNIVYTKINDNKLRGSFSSGAVGEDYHITAKRLLSDICNNFISNYNYMIFADTGPLIDREVALRCDIGYVGRNFSIINSEIGGMFFIGYAITNVPFSIWNKPNINIENNCGSCNNCINACPTGAISLNGFDYKKCISYITQKSGVLSDMECSSIGIQIYGCDICQRSCPKNSFIVKEDERAYPDIEDIINISNKGFNILYKNTAAGWRGKKILQRNAIIALGNLGDKRALPILEKLKYDNRIEISSAAKWADKKLRGNQYDIFKIQRLKRK